MAQVTVPPRRRRAASDDPGESPTKRILNLRLLLISLVIVSLTGLLGHVWYTYRVNQVAGVFLQRATALEQDGQWREAAAYLSRYLQFEPDDLEARVRRVQAVEHVADTAVQRRYLITLLYDTLGRLPARNDLRLKLAQQLLETGNFAEAEKEAGKLVAPEREEDQRTARWIIALSERARARRGGLVSIGDAAKKLAEVQKENPGDVAVASALAELYRSNPQEVEIPDAATAADGIMDQLVAADPQNADALIARYKYRRRFRLPDAQNDLRAVLEHDKDHIEALLLLANDEISTGDAASLSTARQSLDRVIELKPHDPRGYISSAQLFRVQGDPEQALNALLLGRKQVGTTSLELNGVLAETLIGLNRLDEAERVLSEFEGGVRTLLPQLATTGRLQLDNTGRLLRARLEFARNNFGQSIRELNAVVASVEQADTSAGFTVRMQAYSMLAEIMTKLQRLDQAAAYWKTVADQVPSLLLDKSVADQVPSLFRDAGWKAGVAYLQIGRPNEAISQIEAYQKLPSASPDAWISLIQGHLQQQMRLAPDERNWSEFRLAVEQAKLKLPGRWEIELAEASYRTVLGTEDDKKQAVEQLRLIEKRFPKDSALSERLVLSYQQLGAIADAERSLARFDELETSLARRTTLRASMLARQGWIEQASQLLANAAAEVDGNERVNLQLAQIQLLMAANQLDESQQLVSQRIAVSPDEPRLLAVGLDIALLRQDYTTAAQWEDALKSHTTVDDFDWRYFRARRLIGEFAKLDSDVRAELEQLIQSLRSDRPSWFPVVALAGQFAELRGDRRQAIDAYQLSIDLGDNRTETLERLIATLYADGRYNEANSYLWRRGVGQPAFARVETVAIESAVKQDQLEVALDLAKKVVERGSNDPMHYVWLAQLLSFDGQRKAAAGQQKAADDLRKAAEQEFTEATQRFPDDSRVWIGLFGHLVRTQQADKARRVLQTLTEQVKLDEPAKHFVLAQGYELLGDTTVAQQEYRKTIDHDPRNIIARLRLAQSLLSTDALAAREQYEEALKIDPKNAEARRLLAASLAASGETEDWSRAVQLLQTSEPGSAGEASGIDDRLRAILLARKGRNRQERLSNFDAASQILAARISRSDDAALDIDRMLLAGIYEQRALLNDDLTQIQAARDALRPLVDRANPPVNYRVLYINFLLRHLQRHQAKSGDTSSDDELRAALINDAGLRIDELETSLAEKQTVESQLLTLTSRVRLMSIEDRDQEAQELIGEFAERQQRLAKTDADRAKLYLQLGNLCSLVGYDQLAEDWYRRLVVIAPDSYVLLARSLMQQKKANEAVDVCLRAASKKPTAEAAIVLSQLLSSADVDQDAKQRIQAVISSAVKKYNENVNLLMSVAVQRVASDNQDEAIRLFQRVVDLQPKNTLALNNLATLLAERPNQLKEAQEYAERAIRVAGRNPALLDTLGTILTRAGEFPSAVAALEEAVAGSANDPRYYFHLAVAYQRSGRDLDAHKALETSRRYGLDQAILTRGDRELLASLEKDLLAAEHTN